MALSCVATMNQLGLLRRAAHVSLVPKIAILMGTSESRRKAAVMAGFVAKPIYRSPHFTPREEQARANITRELAQLGAPPD
jgi:hypothetical protein